MHWLLILPAGTEQLNLSRSLQSLLKNQQAWVFTLTERSVRKSRTRIHGWSYRGDGEPQCKNYKWKYQNPSWKLLCHDIKQNFGRTIIPLQYISYLHTHQFCSCKAWLLNQRPRLCFPPVSSYITTITFLFSVKYVLSSFKKLEVSKFDSASLAISA